MLVNPAAVNETNAVQPRSDTAIPSGDRVQRIERFGSLHRPHVSHVIFDFDGTLSWLRHGWPRIMLDGFLEHAPDEWRGNTSITSDLLADILSLNGKPTIHQMRSFSQRLHDSSGRSVAPERLFEEYEARLAKVIADRRASIAAGTPCDDFVVHGARRILEMLRSRGVRLIILSGTVEVEVRAEAALLGLSPFFGEHIHGSVRNVAFSKEDVIKRLMRMEKIEGRHLLSFGDGPVELHFTKAAGGLAIGVASDEDENGSHKPDPFKRDQLAAAGAHAVIPDYDEPDLLLKEIFGR